MPDSSSWTLVEPTVLGREWTNRIPQKPSWRSGGFNPLTHLKKNMPEVKLDHFPSNWGWTLNNYLKAPPIWIIENWIIFPKLQVEKKKQNILLKPNHRLETHSKRSPSNVLQTLRAPTDGWRNQGSYFRQITKNQQNTTAIHGPEMVLFLKFKPLGQFKCLTSHFFWCFLAQPLWRKVYIKKMWRLVFAKMLRPLPSQTRRKLPTGICLDALPTQQW